MALLGREAILKAQDLSYQDVSVREWGGKVRVKSLTASERDQFEDSILGAKAKDGTREVETKNLRAKLVAMSVVDKDGNRLFTHEDITALGAKNSAAIDRLFGIAQKLSGIGQKDIEELTKNSGTGHGAGSNSPSPKNSE